MQSDTLAIIGVLAAIAALAIIIWAVVRGRRTSALRERFGDEYDRTLEEQGRRDRAEAALREREERVAELTIRRLDAEERQAAIAEWREVKAVFVDSPVESVHHADRLLASIMTAKGFPMADFARRYEDLTVDHGEGARHYRDGHAITERHRLGEASTEDLRQAMIHFEALFDDLVNEVTGVDKTRPVTRAATTRTADRDGDGEADSVTYTQTADGRRIRPN